VELGEGLLEEMLRGTAPRNGDKLLGCADGVACTLLLRDEALEVTSCGPVCAGKEDAEHRLLLRSRDKDRVRCMGSGTGTPEPSSLLPQSTDNVRAAGSVVTTP